MSRHRTVFFIALSLIGALLVGVIDSSSAQEEQREVYIAQVRGIINPPVANYISRILDEADSENALLVVIEMDTPGGLDNSMREIIQSILDSPVPVAVYVSPSGGRAASAGLFILMGSHIAAMAPSTNTGAAHPVGLGGSGDETSISKAENDAAALIRTLATRRGRNAEWAERAVRESVSATEQEALEQNIIDLIAPTREQLLQDIHGSTIETANGTVTLNVRNKPQREVSMTLAEQLLHIIADPNIAFILLSVGSIGIIAELYNPGVLIPGITGVISLIIAFFSLGNLPTNWAGVALIVVAIVLLVAELNTEGIGVLAVGGIVAFVLGAVILFRPFQPNSPALPSIRVSPWLLGVTTVGMVSFFGLVIRQIVIARNSPLLTGYEYFIGQTAQVRQDLNPTGRVWFQGQLWTAKTEPEQEVSAESQVRIVAVDNLTLIVEPFDEANTEIEKD